MTGEGAFCDHSLKTASSLNTLLIDNSNAKQQSLPQGINELSNIQMIDALKASSFKVNCKNCVPCWANKKNTVLLALTGSKIICQDSDSNKKFLIDVLKGDCVKPECANRQDAKPPEQISKCLLCSQIQPEPRKQQSGCNITEIDKEGFCTEVICSPTQSHKDWPDFDKIKKTTAEGGSGCVNGIRSLKLINFEMATVSVADFTHKFDAEQLKTLEFINCTKLQKLEADTMPSSLKVLYIINANLTAVDPAAIPKMSELREVLITGTPLSNISTSIFYTNDLEAIKLPQNRLQKIAFDVETLPNQIRILDLSGNLIENVKDIPAEIVAKNLELDLTGNPIKSLPENAFYNFQLTSLKLPMLESVEKDVFLDARIFTLSLQLSPKTKFSKDAFWSAEINELHIQPVEPKHENDHWTCADVSFAESNICDGHYYTDVFVYGPCMDVVRTVHCAGVFHLQINDVTLPNGIFKIEKPFRVGWNHFEIETTLPVFIDFDDTAVTQITAKYRGDGAICDKSLATAKLLRNLLVTNFWANYKSFPMALQKLEMIELIEEVSDNELFEVDCSKCQPCWVHGDEEFVKNPRFGPICNDTATSLKSFIEHDCKSDKCKTKNVDDYKTLEPPKCCSARLFIRFASLLLMLLANFVM